MQSVNIHVADVNATFMDVQTRLWVRNENFFDAHVTSVDVLSRWNHVYLVDADVISFTPGTLFL